jgi:dTDP-glucose 4,6-dehydratase/UDP-glucose 4-epimerase
MDVNFMSKFYLVTGGGGFIGAALIKRLLAKGYKVRCLDNFSRGTSNRLKDVLNKIELFTGDIRDASFVKKAVKGVDGVIHLAYINGTEFFYSKPELVLDVAVRGMLNILDACIEYKVKDFVLASSSEVYQTPTEIPSSELVPLIIPDISNPRYSYGGGKIFCELMAMNYGRNHFNRMTIFRPHNVYGPDMGWEHVLPHFIVRAKNNIEKTNSDMIPFEIQGTGEEIRSFIHIDDFTDGLMIVIEKGAHLNVYHIGNPEELSIKEVATMVLSYLGKKPEFIHKELQIGSTLRRCPNINKLQLLGFKPTISLIDGLPTMIDWYMRNIK